MDEKHAQPMPIRRGLSPVRLAIAVGYTLLVAATYWYFQSSSAYRPPVGISNALVPLEAHIMSKCPDARVSRVAHTHPGIPVADTPKDCLHDLILPAMQKAHDKVNFTLSFIGRSVARNPWCRTR